MNSQTLLFPLLAAFSICFLALSKLALHLLGWDDSGHYWLIALLVLPPLVHTFVRQAKKRNKESRYRPPGPLYHVLLGGFVAILYVAWWIGGVLLVELTPLASFFYDRDREELRQRLTALEAAGTHAMAAELIEARLEKSISNEFRSELARRWHKDLLRAAESSASLTRKELHLSQAVSVAERYRLEDLSAELLLEQTRVRLEKQKRIRTLREDRDWTKLVPLLQQSLEDRELAESLPLGLWLTQAHLHWAEQQSNLSLEKGHLEDALRSASAHRLTAEKEIALLRLQKVQDELAQKSRPRKLYRGTQAGLLRVNPQSWPPVLSVDLFVDSVPGVPLLGLEPKDFRASLDGRPVRLQLAPLQQEVHPPSIVLCFDSSGSMQDKMEPARKGAESFLLEVGSQATPSAITPRLKVLAFSDTVTACCDWTTDPHRAAKSLGGLRASGGTALYRALAQALGEFEGKQGPRRIVLFTDGGDTAGGPDLDTLTKQASDSDVQVFTIGLRTEALEIEVLTKLSARTGGTYAEASQPQHLVARYREAARHLRPHFYRLVLSPERPLPTELPAVLEVRVGEPALVLTENLRLSERPDGR